MSLHSFAVAVAKRSGWVVGSGDFLDGVLFSSEWLSLWRVSCQILGVYCIIAQVCMPQLDLGSIRKILLMWLSGTSISHLLVR